MAERSPACHGWCVGPTPWPRKPRRSRRAASPLSFVLVNGSIGFVSRRPDGRLFSVLGFTIAGGKIVEIDILADPERLSRLDLSAIEG